MDMPRKGQKLPHSTQKCTHQIIYIAGPMTGVKSANRPLFAEAAEELRKIGYIVLNPGTLPLGMPKDRYMPICFSMMQAADLICVLPGHEKSAGASIEVAFAKYQDKPIVTYGWITGKEVEE